MEVPSGTALSGIALPVFGATVASARTDWPRAVRVAFAVLAIPVPIIIGADLVGNGLTVGVLLGVVLMVATYAVIVRSLNAVAAPIDDGWRMRRPVKILVLVSTALLVLFAAGTSVGLG